MLNRDEREYLYRAAGGAPPQAPGISDAVGTTVRLLLESMTHVPAYVVDAKYDLLAWNDLALHFIHHAVDDPTGNRNMVRWMFHAARDDSRWDGESATAFARATVADLRASYARYAGDPGLDALITEMISTSTIFERMWAAHEVDARRRVTKKIDSETLGPLEFDCQVLHIPETGQRLITYCAEPGSPTRELFQRLGHVRRGP
ncbi:hypothetical protein LR393_23065 [Kineosporia mesophila]|nr:hypothetical protein [Kineosporia mesophila]MCD5352963.1 hypothetical protein [Kineosporia mesophila]